MIGSKRITVFAFLIMGLVVVLTFAAILFTDKLVPDTVFDEFDYGNGHKISIEENDRYTDFSSIEDVENIILNSDTVSSNSKNVEIKNNTVTILAGGYYKISGELYDGSIIIDSMDDVPVFLLLAGANITSTDFSALYVKQAKKVILSVKDGTENRLTDGTSYNTRKQENSKPNAVIHSKDDLTINGGGILYITGNFADGIKGNDDLKIIGSNITVNAKDEGINANNYVFIKDSTLNITSEGDGIKCEEETADKGFAAIENSSFNITSSGDGISASSAVYINGGEYKIISGGGSENAVMRTDDFGGFGGFGGRGKSTVADDTASTKGIKAGTDLSITNGAFDIDSLDDAIHSNGNVTIDGGNFVILSGDDAVHADNTVTISPYSMDIQKCYEGIEGAFIVINGGDIKIVSSDDGINAAGLNSNGGRPMMFGSGGEAKTAEEDVYLTLNGGNVVIETSGDGFDSNGSALMNGGTLQIYGPESGMNGSIDVGDGGYVFIVNGGTLLASGSSGMAETPHEGSKQNTLTFYLDKYYSSGSEISIVDHDENVIVSGVSSKKFNWICVCDKNIVSGKTYTLRINGNDIASLKCSKIVTQFGDRNGSKMIW